MRTLSSRTRQLPSPSRTRSQPATWHQIPPGGRTPCTARSKYATAEDELPGDQPLAQDLLAVVDVVEERVERLDPLLEAALDRLPLGRRDDPGDEVERERAVARAAIGAGDLEGHSALGKDPVAAAAEVHQRDPAHAIQARDHLAAVGAGRPLGRRRSRRGSPRGARSRCPNRSAAAQRPTLRPAGRSRWPPWWGRGYVRYRGRSFDEWIKSRASASTRWLYPKGRGSSLAGGGAKGVLAAAAQVASAAPRLLTAALLELVAARFRRADRL